MKKRGILITSLLATISMPLISFVACKDTNTNVTVFFLLGEGGEIPGVVDNKMTVVPNFTTFGMLPTPTKNGYIFDGWQVSGEDVASDALITKNTLVVAKWIATRYRVFFNLLGGYIEGVENPEEGLFFNKNTTYGMLPQPKRFGYNFDGWFVYGSLANPNDLITDGVTVVASYTEVEPLPGELVISGGHTRLDGQCLTGKHQDDSPWLLKYGEIFLQPQSLDFVPIGSTDVSFLSFNNSLLCWDSDITPGEYHFKVRARYNAWSVLSEEIILKISPIAFNNIESADAVSWKQLAHACKLLEDNSITEDEFASFFIVDDLSEEGYNPKPATSIDDLIGQKRKIKIKTDQTVMVVGCKKDVYKVSDANNATALTFQFDEVLYLSDTKIASAPREIIIGSKKNFDYWNSNLEKLLNSESSVEWPASSEKRSLLKMAEDADQDKEWFSYIKPVSRSINVNRGTSESVLWVPETKTVKFFIPTISNFFSEKGIKQAGSAFIKKQDQDKFLAEGQTEIADKQYQFYKKYIADDVCDENNHWECLQRKNKTGGIENWWLPTSCYSLPFGDNEYCWAIEEGNGRLLPCRLDFYRTFAPCFCI